MELFLRKINTTDEAFLYQLFISSRPDLEALAMENPVSGELLLRQQFSLHVQMFHHHPQADLWIVEYQEQPIGRLYIEKDREWNKIVSIAILPDYQNRGFGRTLIQNVQHEAVKRGCGCQLAVAWYNSDALRLYERLGFEILEDNPVYSTLGWKPVDDKNKCIDNQDGNRKIHYL